MPRPINLSVAFSLGIVAGCTQQGALPTVNLDLPEADLSGEAVDFGDVAWGDSASRQVVLTNTGDLPMGIEHIALSEDGMEDST